MKNLLVVLSACLSLTACAVNTDSEPEETTVQNGNNGEYDGAWHQDEGPIGCDRVSLIHVAIDGHDFWVQIPTLCDRRPYIFKGDPGPDIGDPYDDRYGPIPNEDILDSFHARFAAPSNAHSAPVQ